jgi:hypothetical protein
VIFEQRSPADMASKGRALELALRIGRNLANAATTERGRISELPEVRGSALYRWMNSCSNYPQSVGLACDAPNIGHFKGRIG